jgi:hypothetical protein
MFGSPSTGHLQLDSDPLAPAAEYDLTRICRDGYVLIVESAFERHLDSTAPKPQEKADTR